MQTKDTHMHRKNILNLEKKGRKATYSNGETDRVEWKNSLRGPL